MEEDANLTEFELGLLFIHKHVDNNPSDATKEPLDLLKLNQNIHE